MEETRLWAPPLPSIPPSPKPHDYDDVDAPEGSRQPKRQRLPQAIAHRGYSAVAPENTMESFRRAVEVGAHAIETDLRLSRDGVVVLMHDPSLKRTFGDKSKVRDHDWSYLSALRTLRKPHEPMARLVELLEYLNEPGMEHIWVVLDIKRDGGEAAEVMQRIAETVASVPASKRPWTERILVCCWNASFIRQAQEHMPTGTQISHVGFSTTYSRALLRHAPNLGISLLRITLASPLRGPRIIRDMREKGVPLFVWTVNEESWMRWAVRNRLDGVITDDPKLFLDVCSRRMDEGEGEGVKEKKGSLIGTVGGAAKLCVQIALIEIIHLIWLIILVFRYGGWEGEVRKSFEG